MDAARRAGAPARSRWIVGLVYAALSFTLYLGFAACAAVAVAAAVVAGTGTLPPGTSLNVEVGFRPVGQPAPSEPGPAIRRATGDLALGEVSGGVVLLWVVPLLLLLAIGTAIAHQLRAVVGTVRAGQPFVPANVRRIRVVAALVFVLSAVSVVARPLVTAWADRTYDLPGIELVSAVRVDLGVLLAGFVVLVLAEVFRVGAELHEADRLTV